MVAMEFLGLTLLYMVGSVLVIGLIVGLVWCGVKLTSIKRLCWLPLALLGLFFIGMGLAAYRMDMPIPLRLITTVPGIGLCVVAAVKWADQ